MITTEKTLQCQSRSETFRLYTLGDIHLGALNCAERSFRTMVRKIEKDDNALWIGGGDMCDYVILNDAKRFDVNTLPDWILSGDAATIKERIGDMVMAQQNRFLSIVDPIRDKCLGLLEGNHEFSIFKYHNRRHMDILSNSIGAPVLSDSTFIRLRFRRSITKSRPKGGVGTVIIFACHGHGGGRTPGAEPNKLYRLAADKDADIVLRGHSHTFCILPPIPILGISRTGRLQEEATTRLRHAANWGSYVHTYQKGASTYASRATYPVKPMFTVETEIKPFPSKRITRTDGKHQHSERPNIIMREVEL